MEQNEVRYETYLTDDAEMIVVAYGIGARIAKGAIKRLREEGLKVGHDQAHHALAFPREGATGDGEDGQRLLRLRDERRSDGGGRQTVARGKGSTSISTGGPGGVVPMPIELYRIISRHYYQAQAAGKRKKR